LGEHIHEIHGTTLLLLSLVSLDFIKLMGVFFGVFTSTTIVKIGASFTFVTEAYNRVYSTSVTFYSGVNIGLLLLLLLGLLGASEFLEHISELRTHVLESLM